MDLQEELHKAKEQLHDLVVKLNEIQAEVDNAKVEEHGGH